MRFVHEAIVVARRQHLFNLARTTATQTSELTRLRVSVLEPHARTSEHNDANGTYAQLRTLSASMLKRTVWGEVFNMMTLRLECGAIA